MVNRVIVTGANGFIGSSLIYKLIQNNIEVVAIDITFENCKLPDNNLISKISCSLDNYQQLEESMPNQQYDVFYHLAWAGVNGPSKANPDVQLKNIQMAINCAKVAKKMECKKFLCSGTIAEQSTNSLPNLNYTTGGMLYGAAKQATHILLETFCKNVELDFVWMQFSNIYGPRNKTGNLVSYTINEINKNNDATFGPALQPYDFIYVDDLIEAIFRLGVNKTNKCFYFIGSGEPRLLKEYLLKIGEIYSKKELIKIGVRPDDGIKYTMDMFDVSSLKEDIGNYISKTFEEGINEIVKYKEKTL